MHVRSAIGGPESLPFSFFRQGSIPLVGYRTSDVSTTAAAPYTWKSGLPVIDFD